MKTALKSLFVATIAVVLAAPLTAWEPDEKDKVKGRVPAPVKALDAAVQELELGEEQQEQYQKIYQQHVPMIQKLLHSQLDIYTPEQRKQRKGAKEKGMAEGLKGKKLRDFVQSQIELTPDQQKQFVDGQVKLLDRQQKFRQEVIEILTPAQQEQLRPSGGKKGKGKRGSNK